MSAIDTGDPNEKLFATLQAQVEIIVADLRAQPIQTHWTDWMETALIYIRARDAAGVRYFRSAHGGMGSFNDWAPLTEAGWRADEAARELADQLMRRSGLRDSGADLRHRQRRS